MTALLLALPACERRQSTPEKVKGAVDDALDRRPAEGVRDAVEDAEDAVKDAAKDIKDATRDGAQDVKKAVQDATPTNE